ncbi:MAG: hypothetical protein ABJP70_11620 [Erythrobacter sp.]
MKTIFAAAALSLGAALCVPASAQAQTEYDANRIVADVDLAELRNLAAALGFEVLEANENQRPEVVLRSDSGRSFFLRGYVCKKNEGKAGCQGLLMFSRYNQPPGLTPSHVKKADDETVVVQVWINANDKVRVDRYLILDNGVTFGNLLENIKVFLASNQKAVTTMLDATKGS